MLLRTLAIFSASILLIANTEFDHLRGRKPALVFDTSKTPEDVAACLVKQAFYGAPTIIPEGSERDVILTTGGHATMLFVITATATGSHVEQHRLLPVGGKKSHVLSCA